MLGTSNYVLYILAYAQANKALLLWSVPRALLALAGLAAASADSKVATPTGSGSSRLAQLTALVSRTRTALRLLGLVPLYALLRSLQSGRGSDGKRGAAAADPVVHRIAVTQCVAYLAYQALENAAVLADHGVVPARAVAALARPRWRRAQASTAVAAAAPSASATAPVYRLAYRCWLAAVACDLVRLAREAWLLRRRRSRQQQQGAREDASDEEEPDALGSKWWGELAAAFAWFPMALHFSSDAGVPGWNAGIMGVCGLVGSHARTKALWDATRDA